MRNRVSHQRLAHLLKLRTTDVVLAIRSREKRVQAPSASASASSSSSPSSPINRPLQNRTVPADSSIDIDARLCSRDAVYERIRLPNARSLHWSIAKVDFGSILLEWSLETALLIDDPTIGFDVLVSRSFYRAASRYGKTLDHASCTATPCTDFYQNIHSLFERYIITCCRSSHRRLACRVNYLAGLSGWSRQLLAHAIRLRKASEHAWRSTYSSRTKRSFFDSQ